MTPDVLRAAIASAREHPRMYGDDPGDLESYLHGLVAGAYDGNRDVSEVWSALRDPPLRPGVYPDATFDSVCDHALRVVAALCPPPGAPDALDPDALVAEVRRLRAEVDEADARAGRFAELLRATADALKGPPQPLALHSWHDLPEVAAALRAEVERLRADDEATREGVVYIGASCDRETKVHGVWLRASRLGPPSDVRHYAEAMAERDAARAEVERLRRLVDTSPPDDPEADGTDAAHPAWWRGNDAGCRGALSLVARLRAEVDALKAPIARRVAPSVAVDVGDDGDLVVVTRSEAEAFAAAHPYAAGAILGGVAHRSEGGDHGA